MCNYNMENTIERSLLSILKQVDNSFEIVLVDDGSTDNSVKVVKRIQINYDNLRLIELKRDKNRKLGLTRNIAIKNAKGKYVLLHLDCDDVFGPFLHDFVTLFEKIEQAENKHILLSGQHVNMANRDFLLSHGPYKNIYRGEDRDLWRRLAAIDRYIPFDHIDFIVRIPKTVQKKVFKSIYDTFDHTVNNFRLGMLLKRQYYLVFKDMNNYNKRTLVLRILIIFPAWIVSLFHKKLSNKKSLGFEDFVKYRDAKRTTYLELIQRHGGDTDVSFLSDKAKKIFKC